MDICEESELIDRSGEDTDFRTVHISGHATQGRHTLGAFHTSHLLIGGSGCSGIPHKAPRVFPTADAFLASLPQAPKYPNRTADAIPLHWDICMPRAANSSAAAARGGNYVSHQYTSLFAGGQMQHARVPVPEQMIGSHFSNHGTSLSFARARAF